MQSSQCGALLGSSSDGRGSRDVFAPVHQTRDAHPDSTGSFRRCPAVCLTFNRRPFPVIWAPAERARSHPARLARQWVDRAR